MRRALELELIDRVLEHARAKTTDLADSSAREPIAAYRDPQQFTRDIGRLFRGPLAIAHEGQLAEPGDFVTFDDFGTPLLLVRDRSGTVRCFLNVCRHRSTKLVWQACGKGAKAFTCPYHAWTYADDGTLTGLPGREGFPLLATEPMSLVSLPVELAHGLSWVGLEPGTSLDLDADLGPLAHELAGLELDRHVEFRPRSTHWEMNWRLAVDGALEAYHFAHAHRATIGPMFLNNTLVYDSVGPHARMVLAKRSIVGLADQPRESWQLRPHANILYFLFPSTVLIVQPDHVAFIRIAPESVARTRVDNVMLIPAANDRPIPYWDRNYQVMHDALDEDFRIGEQIQRTLDSGANEAMNFGRNEIGVQRFHAAVDHRLAQT